ncbi:hypothetical protein PIB30_105759 [Stylosanthes scabra]|uniref:Uncharacterized protein n=1 Tax=Stylosanthes scabra TaxID=79078 RepID=A0ABU6ZXI8_9FABA|nr:hypothetical protein [Stylosanthes scabra]
MLDRESVMFHKPGVLLISDRHLGNDAALRRAGCGWEHNAFCVRLIVSNFATKFKIKESKGHMINAAYSKTKKSANYWLHFISTEDRVTSPAMTAYIKEIEPHKWLQHLDEG